MLRRFRLWEFRWWLARKIAPRHVYALYVKGDDNCRDAHTVHFMGDPMHNWGHGYRYVTPRMVEVLNAD